MTKEQAFALVFEPTTSYADVMTIEEFASAVVHQSIMDSDGMGYLAIRIDDTIYEGPESIHCGIKSLYNAKQKGWTHVCWYNK